MKFKSIFIPQAECVLKSASIYQIVVIVLALTGTILARILGDQWFTTNNIDMCSAIFVMVSGLVLFKESLHLGMANGVSRRTVYAGMMAVGLLTSVLLSLINMLLSVLFSSQISNEIIFGLGGGDNFFARLAIAVCLHMAFFAIGYFLAGCFYRLGKLGRTLFASGVPVFLFVFLPIIISVLPAEAQMPLRNFFGWLIAFILASVWNFALVLLCILLPFAFFSWLLIRRAPMKA